ncbi:MAG: TerB family tellurite resistance protein [Bacteroidota bacterium]
MNIVVRQQLNMLVQLARADENFAEIEKETILRIARANNFPESELRKLILNPEPIGSFGALSLNQKFEYLYNSVDLMMVDDSIHNSEKLFCMNIAIKLGFKKDVIDFLIKEIKPKRKETLKDIVFAKYT